MTYDELQTTIRHALDMHVFANDPMLLSAVERLTPFLECDDPDAIELNRTGTMAYEFVHRMLDAKVTLYG
jgi:hypothetical protein